MSENSDRDSDHFGDTWMSKWEEQCLQDWESESNMEDRIQRENERATQKLWLSFQNSATTIADLYKEGCHENCVSLWLPFQNCASSLTNLYKAHLLQVSPTKNEFLDSLDASVRSFELGTHIGHYRRTRDVLAWAKKRRRHIRREELIAYLSGRPLPARSRSSAAVGGGVRTVVKASSPRLQPVAEEGHLEHEPDLQTFQDALALQGLSGAMSNVSMRHGGVDTGAATGGGGLHCFIVDEMRRRSEARKRSTASDTHDSPGRKRSRLF